MHSQSNHWPPVVKFKMCTVYQKGYHSLWWVNHSVVFSSHYVIYIYIIHSLCDAFSRAICKFVCAHVFVCLPEYCRQSSWYGLVVVSLVVLLNLGRGGGVLGKYGRYYVCFFYRPFYMWFGVMHVFLSVFHTTYLFLYSCFSVPRCQVVLWHFTMSSHVSVSLPQLSCHHGIFQH